MTTSILSDCLSIHMHLTGAGPLNSDDFLKKLERIRVKLQNWSDGPEYTKNFDDAVKELCLVTVSEVRERSAGLL